jgi:hypothetical protein
MAHIHTMSRKVESPTDVEHWFRAQAADLWPAALGSLSLRRSPCVRDHCPACERGDQHTSYVLYGRIKGRRIALYIPDDLEPEIRRALENGRALQELLYEAGRRYTNAVKHQRAHADEGEQ